MRGLRYKSVLKDKFDKIKIRAHVELEILCLDQITQQIEQLKIGRHDSDRMGYRIAMVY